VMMFSYMPVTKNNLLYDICRCSNVEDCFYSGDHNNPCYKIVMAQGVSSTADFQTPEPWSGSIDAAPILFVGDTNKIFDEEEYPTWSWSDYLMEDYFNCRFSGGRKQWIKDGLYTLNKNGLHAAAWNRFWAACRNRALELHQKVDVVPGYDFSITTAVRCRTKNLSDIKGAALECVKRYLGKVINLSSAVVIVGLGELASNSIRSIFDIKDGSNMHGPVTINKKERYFAFLHHQNTKGSRSFGETFTLSEMNQLIYFLKKN
jgi:hypothetical protein